MDNQLFDRVLIIEDNDSHAMLVTRAVRSFVNSVRHAASLQAAREALREFTPDLVLTDLYLGDANRADLVRAICEALPSVPVIVLTSSSSLEDAVAAMKVGARDFIVKTFDDQFKEALSFALKRVADLYTLERERLRLQAELALLQRAIESSDDALGVIDGDDGSIRYANQSFTRVVGGGDSFFNLLAARFAKGEQLAVIAREKMQQLSPGSVWQSQLSSTEEPVAHYDVTFSVLAAGNRRGIVVWLRNVTEQRRRERFQREILSTTTHDLKGPLGAILLSTELLSEALPADSKERQLAVRIGSSAQNALDLIEEFLSARRIQEGTFVLKPSAQDLTTLIDEVIEAHRNMADARDITLQMGSLTVTEPLMVDRSGFLRVLGNLVNNALKYTPKGGRVEVHAFERPGMVHVQVRDTGSGIEPSEVVRIFERFSRLDKHRDVAGSGLGLFVVKSVVAAHGGTVEVTSKVGEGSIFDVGFPTKPPVNERGELIVLDFK